MKIQSEISLPDFLNLLKSDDKQIKTAIQNIDNLAIRNIDYETLWRFADTKEEELVKDNIISIEQQKINTKKTILNIEGFAKSLGNYISMQRHLSIAKFIKKTNLSISHTTLYRLIGEKEQELTENNIINISRSGSKKTIKIIDFKQMENFIRENTEQYA